MSAALLEIEPTKMLCFSS